MFAINTAAMYANKTRTNFLSNVALCITVCVSSFLLNANAQEAPVDQANRDSGATNSKNSESESNANTDSLAANNEHATKADIARTDKRYLDEQKQNLLRQAYPQEQIIEITSGNEAFLGLWQNERTGNPVGTVLILHGEGQTADWPHTIGAIRQDLPLRAWSTLAIALPDPAERKVPKRTESSGSTKNMSDSSDGPIDTNAAKNDEADLMREKNEMRSEPNSEEETADSSSATSTEKMEKKTISESAPFDTLENFNALEDFDKTEERALARIDAAVTHLQGQGQYNIVIAAHGLAAHRALRYVEKSGAMKPQSTQENRNIVNNPDIELERTIRAVIFMNARNRIHNEQSSLSDMLNIKEMPVLDLFFKLHFLDEKDGQERKIAARNMQLPMYFQLSLIAPSTTVFEEENRVTRRIRGFLKTHAQGVKIPDS